MTTTWSTTDKSAGCTLSGGNLVASFPSSNGAVRSVDRVYSGKYYWEVTFTTLLNLCVGVSMAAAPLNNTMAIGNATGYTFLVTQAGAIFAPGNVVTNVGGTVTAGWVLCIALDASIGQVWFRNGASGFWDNNAAHNPATGVGGYNMASYFGGPPYGYYASANGGSGGGTATANFGASAFVGAVPAGFTAGFPDSTGLFTYDVATQIVAEHWAAPAPPAAQMTQIVVEHWAAVGTSPPQVVLTQIAVEHWVSLAPATTVQPRALVMA